MRAGFWLIAGLVVLTASQTAIAQNEPPADALRYHKVLRDRPDFGTVFERFVETWLESSDAEALEAFLKSNLETAADELLLARFQLRSGSREAAAESLELATERFPEDGRIWLTLAEIQIELGDSETAVEAIRKSLETEISDEDREQARLTLGRELAALGETAAAVAELDQLLDEKPAKEIFEDVIDLLVEAELLEQAAERAKRWIALAEAEEGNATEVVQANLRFAEIRFLQERPDQALQILSAVLVRSGQNDWMEREILDRMERGFRQTDDLVGLTEFLSELAARDKLRIAPQRRLAQALVETGKIDEAKQVFVEILGRTPGARAIREEFIALLERMGEPDEAVAQARIHAEAHPNDAEWRLKLAGLLSRSAAADEAEKEVREFLRISGSGEVVRLRAAREFEKIGRFKSAEETFRGAANDFPESFEAGDALAQFLFRRNERKEAAAVWMEMAEGAEIAEVIQISRILFSRRLSEPAFRLISDRQAEIQTNRFALQLRCDLALAVGRPEAAVGDARRLVLLSEESDALAVALDSAVLLIRRADQVESMTAELRAREDRPVQETCLLAELVAVSGRLDEAEEILQNVPAEHRSLALAQQIRLHQSAKNWPAAAEVAQQILELPRGRTPGNLRRIVDFYLRSSLLKDALKWAREWERAESGRTEASVQIAEIQLQLGDGEGAVETLRTATGRRPDDVLARSKLAEILADADRLDEAEPEFRRLYELAEGAESKLRWLKDWAHAADETGLQKLIDEFEDRRRRSPNIVEPVLALVELQRIRGDHNARLELLRAAAEIDRNNIALKLELADLEERFDSIKEAHATLTEARKFDPTGEATRRLAAFYNRHNQEARALRVLLEDAAYKLEGDEVIEAVSRFSSNDKWDEALEILRPFVPKFRRDFRIQYLFGIALEEAGESESAVEQFLKLATAPDDPDQQTTEAQKAKRQEIYAMLEGRETDATGLYLELGPLPAGTEQLLRREAVEGLARAHHDRLVGMIAFKPDEFHGDSRVYLPTSADEARELAMANLRRLSMESDELRVEFTAKLEAGGVERPEIQLRSDLFGDLRRAIENSDEATMKLFRNDPVVVAWLLASPFGEDYVGADARTVAMFQDEFPNLAILASLAWRRRDPGPDSLAALRESCERVGSHATGLVIRLGDGNQVWNRRLVESGEDDLWDEAAQVLIETLEKWKISPGLSLEEAGRISSSIFSLKIACDPAAARDFLTAELEKWQPVPPPTPGSKQRRAPTGGFLKPLNFPPRDLIELPTWMHAAISRDASQFQGVAARFAEDPQALDDFLEECQDPRLLISFARMFGARSWLQQLLTTAENANLDTTGILLLAAWALENRQVEPALALMIRARRDASPDQQRMIDAAIIAEAVRGEKEFGYVELSALERLLRMDLFWPEIQELMEAARRCTNEELRLRIQKTKALPNLWSHNSYSKTWMRQLAAERRISQLYEAGRTEEAMLAIWTRVNAFDAHLRAQDASVLERRSGFSQLLVSIDGFSSAHFLDWAEARCRGSASDLLDFVEVCELLKEDHRALRVCRQLLAEDPKNADLWKWRLGLLRRVGNPYKFVRAFLEIPEEVVGQLGIGPAGFSPRTLDDFLDLTNVLKEKPELEDDLAWTIGGIEDLLRNDLEIAHAMFRPDGIWLRYPDRRAESVLESGLTMLEEFSARYVEDERQAMRVFVIRSALARVQGRPIDEIAEEARRALRSFLENEGGARVIRPVGTALTTLDPASWLIRESWREQRDLWAEINFEAVADRFDIDLRKFAELYECEDLVFEFVAREFSDEGADPVALHLACLAWVDRGCPGKLDWLLLGAAKANPTLGSDAGAHVLALTEMAKLGRAEEVKNFLADFRHLRLRSSDVADHSAVFDYLRTLSVFEQSPWLMPLVAEAPQPSGSFQIQPVFNLPRSFSSVDFPIALSQESRQLGDFAEFSQLAQNEKSGAYFGDLVRVLKNSPLEVHDSYRNWLFEQPPTFGREAMLAALPGAEPLEFRWIEQLLEMPRDQQAILADTLLKNLSLTNSSDAELRAIRAAAED